MLAQGWKIHPRNLDQILRAYPRDGFADETAKQVAGEIARHPRCRFAAFGPAFPALTRRATFPPTEETAYQ